MFTLFVAGLIQCSGNESAPDATVIPIVEKTDVSTTQPLLTITAVPTTQPLPTVTAVPPQSAPDLFAFQDQISTALAASDVDALTSLMSRDFGMGAWRSEWQLTTPQDAADQIFANHLAENRSLAFQQRTADEITALLGGQPAADMLGPDVNIVSFLHSSGWGLAGADEALLFIVEEDGRFAWKAVLYTNGTFTQAAADLIAAPPGLMYNMFEQGLFVIDLDGEPRQLTSRDLALPAPDGRFAAYTTIDRQLFLINTETGSEEQIGSGANLSGFFLWGDNDTLLIGVWLDPNEADSPNLGHIATLDIATSALQILDETSLSGSRPDMADDGQWIALTVFQEPPLNSQLYHPDSGLQPFDPAAFAGADAITNSPLFNPAWSPDGHQIAWLSSTGERVYLQLFDLEQQTAVQRFDWDPARFGALIPSPVWSPDGKWLAVEVWANGPEGSGIWLIAADGSGERLVDEIGSNPYWVNDSQLVYNHNSGVVHLFDITDGTFYALDLPAGGFVVGFANPSQLSAPGNTSTTTRYSDPELGVAFEDDPSWQLSIQEDDTWQVITLSQNEYEFRLRIQPLPDEIPVCSGILTAANLVYFHTYTVAGLELWRAKAEMGFVNGYQDENIAFIDIVSPVFYDQPTDQGILGEMNCVFAAAGKLLSIEYMLPVNIMQLQDGAYETTLLEEMDLMLTSLTLYEP